MNSRSATKPPEFPPRIACAEGTPGASFSSCGAEMAMAGYGNGGGMTPWAWAARVQVMMAEVTMAEVAVSGGGAR